MGLQFRSAGQEPTKNPFKVAMFFDLFIDSFLCKVIKWASNLPLWEKTP